MLSVSAVKKLSNITSWIKNPNISIDVMKGVQYSSSYVLKNDSLWQSGLYAWIQNKNMEPVYFYFDLWRHKNEYGILIYDFDQVWGNRYVNKEQQVFYWKLDKYLDEMRDNGIYDLLKEDDDLKPIWKQLKEWLSEATRSTLPDWWNNHIGYSIASKNETYLRGLMAKKWPMTCIPVIRNIRENNPLFDDLINYILHTDQSCVFKTENITTYIKIINNVVYSKITDKSPQIAFITECIRRSQNSVEFQPQVNHLNQYALEELIRMCIMQKKYKPILDAILSKINTEHATTMVWLKNALKRYIQPVVNQSPSQKELEAILRTFITTFKINLNTVEFQLNESLGLSNERLAPYRELGQTIPVLTYAILSRNTRAAKFFIIYGATIENTPLYPDNLINEPGMRSLMSVKRKINLIQSEYRRHMYHPEHSSQSIRTSTWNEHLENYKKIHSSQLGGKRKKRSIKKKAP